jgi:RNA polymerase sigma-70 factor (ECF subfamily)
VFSFEKYDVAVPASFAPDTVTSVEDEVLSLFESFRSRLMVYAMSFGLSVHDAEDVIQEVFLALFHHLQKGRSRSNLRGWVFRVTHNLALKRRMNRRTDRFADDENDYTPENNIDPDLTPEQQLLFSERQAQLNAVFQVLPDNDRWCLQLRAEGLRYREIAQIVGISLASVSTSIAHSMRRLTCSDEA